MLPTFQERQRYDYAGYTIVIVEDRVDHEWSAVAKKKGRDAGHQREDGDILAGWHPQAHLAAQEIERLIAERVRAEAPDGPNDGLV